MELDTTVLTVTGDLTIRGVSALHEQFSDSLRDYSEVKVSIADHSAVDLTFIQLVESARRTARETDRTFSLADPASGPLLDALRRGGFLRSGDQREFWLQDLGEPA